MREVESVPSFRDVCRVSKGAAYQLSLEDLSRAVLLRVIDLLLVGQLIEGLGGLVGSRELVQAVRSRQGVGRLELEGFGVAVEGDDELGAGRERELVVRVACEDCRWGGRWLVECAVLMSGPGLALVDCAECLRVEGEIDLVVQRAVQLLPLLLLRTGGGGSGHGFSTRLR